MPSAPVTSNRTLTARKLSFQDMGVRKVYSHLSIMLIFVPKFIFFSCHPCTYSPSVPVTMDQSSASTTSAPSITTPTTNDGISTESSDSSLSSGSSAGVAVGGAVGGIIVGVLIVVAVIALLIGLAMSRHRSKAKQRSQNNQQNHDTVAMENAGYGGGEIFNEAEICRE